ncbi:MAG: redoxin domain-containing protein [Phycisphaerales bacterium]|nr:MAG: redoxin domain-containing protein [Phycisphaerales bacterium]
MSKAGGFVMALLLGAMVAGTAYFASIAGEKGSLSRAVASIDRGGMELELNGEDEMAPELSPNLGWVNTSVPLRFSDELKGHVVILDFWTYCCINCMHILPDLEFIEEKYKDQPVVVVGVHSAKFDNEGQRASVERAVKRYSIHHPVVIDDGMGIWTKYGVRAWPSFVVVDSRGFVVGSESGEGNRELLDQLVGALLEKGKKEGTLAAKAWRDPKAGTESSSKAGTKAEDVVSLSFPGKVLATRGDGGWLFVSDSTGNRVIAARLPGEDGVAKVERVIGKGWSVSPERTLVDGAADEAVFHDPQGLAFDGTRILYVADRENHAIRTIDTTTWRVGTLVGTGKQGYDRRGGRAGVVQSLASPWDVALSADVKTLYVAMAGTHQLWSVDVASGEARALAGSGRESIIDGSAREAALAQPSGLSLSGDGGTLYFADSETSAIRAMDLAKGTVRTIIGRGLFEFGDVDGTYPEARLQHCLGVSVIPGEAGKLLVADTYNHRLKIVDAGARSSRAFVGMGKRADGAIGEMKDLYLDEPGGVCVIGGVKEGEAAVAYVADTNNQRIIEVNLETKAWRVIRLKK